MPRLMRYNGRQFWPGAWGIDEIARQLGIDPLEFPLKNLIVDGEDTASGERFEHVRVHETLQAGAEVEDGRVTNLSFGDYKLPTMRDAPSLTTVLVESANDVGPYQIKGIGESSISPVAPAIANAAADAVGVRIRDLPLTAEKVSRALQDNAHS